MDQENTVGTDRVIEEKNAAEKQESSPGRKTIINGVIQFISAPLLVYIISTIFAILGSSAINSKYIMPKQISDIDKSVEKLEKTVEKETKKIERSITSQDERLRKVENNFSAYTGVPLASKETEYSFFTLTNEGVKAMAAPNRIEENTSNVGLNCSDDSKIAVDSKSKKIMTAKSLINQKVVLSYKENGQEVYFLGQFNEIYHWNGECTINVYKNDILILITDAVYDDGNLISYKQVLDHEKDSVDTWIISDRKHEYDKKTKKYFNSGYSKSYYKTKEKKKDFDLDNVKYSDITSVDEFEESLNAKQEGYYCGNTSDGSFNDDSGKAYIVKYNKDGFIRLFYCGKFKNGHQCDYSGQAWDIVLDEQEKYYFYRRAEYEDDKIIYSTLRDSKECMTGKQAEKKLKKELGDITVDCKLKWKK